MDKKKILLNKLPFNSIGSTHIIIQSYYIPFPFINIDAKTNLYLPQKGGYVIGM